ncbi:MAG: TfoX/Sxy family protein [Paracoccaceae bacterium]
MTDPVSAIRNLGPASDESFARAGINTAEQVRELGADAAYARVLQAGSRPHFIAYYALVMGLQGRPWNDLDPAEKLKLRSRFDHIVAENRAVSLSGIERELDALGVRVNPCS